MITSVPASDIFDISQYILEKLGLDEKYDINDMGVSFGVRPKYREDAGTDRSYIGTFLHFELRDKSNKGERTFAQYEIPIDYRTNGEPAYDIWREQQTRKK